MSNTPTALTPDLYRYVLDVTLREPEVLRALRDETARLPEHNMQVSPDEGQFLQLLVRITGARRVLEVGTFTGYSALAMALALPDGGRLVTCDVSEAFTAVARRAWTRAGVDGRVELRLGPALGTLEALLAAGAGGSFDLAFLDADKANYPAYFERLLELVRPGGLIAIDNVLWSGRVLAPADEDTRAIDSLSRRLRDDARVDVSLVPIADGITLARKR